MDKKDTAKNMTLDGIGMAAIGSAIVLNGNGNTESAIVALLIGVVCLAIKYLTRE